jgi:hypothetical protein
MSRPTLYLRPLNGLCNRMRAVASARTLAAAAGADLVVLWEVGPGLAIRYEDLFHHDGSFRVRNIEPLRSKLDALLYLLYSETPRVRGVPTAWLTRAIFGDNILRQLRPEDHSPATLEAFVRGARRTLISSWWAFHGDPEPDFSFFKPHPAQQAAVDEIAQAFGPGTIGVHIRRTDNANAIRYSPTSAFVAAMQRRLRADPDARFFLATDCAETEAAIRAVFGARVITRPRVASRDTREGMLDAVVDLFALSRTSRILGSYYSTFSETAASLGGIKWVTVTDDASLIGRVNSDVMLALADPA